MCVCACAICGIHHHCSPPFGKIRVSCFFQAWNKQNQVFYDLFVVIKMYNSSVAPECVSGLKLILSNVNKISDCLFLQIWLVCVMSTYLSMYQYLQFTYVYTCIFGSNPFLTFSFLSGWFPFLVVFFLCLSAGIRSTFDQQIK